MIHPDAFVHESAYVDEPADIGAGTKIWHFVHVLARTRIGETCILGQNVMAGPDVVIGDGCKVQNNVALYRGVTLERGGSCGPSCVFTNVLTPRAIMSGARTRLPLPMSGRVRRSEPMPRSCAATRWARGAWSRLGRS